MFHGMEDKSVTGIGASVGIGMGQVVLIKEQNITYDAERTIKKEIEIERFHQAVKIFCQNTTDMAERLRAGLGDKEAEILEGQIMMVEDPYLTSEVERLIGEGQCAEAALDAVCQMFMVIFSSAEDELTNQRTTDVHDINIRMLKILLHVEEIDISEVPPHTILVAKDLTPSMTAGIRKENVAGIITELGGKTSHSAILARALEIPAVLSVENAMELFQNGDQAIVDGCFGQLIKNPDAQVIEEYKEKREEFLKSKRQLSGFIGKPSLTADGKKVELVANIGKPEDANLVVQYDGEGVGLFRTEFLFMDRTSLPSEEEQFDAYKKAAIILKGKPVIIRTLDIGGDKALPYLGLEKEENPFLGYRAVRFCLNKKDVYQSQLRAILRASAYGDIRIMVPLVTCIEELRAVKEMISEIMKDLDNRGVAYNKEIKTGVMMETPAASQIADLLAKEADFFSIGTNDLTQYTMAVDRGNAKVAYLYSTYQPAVLRSIKHIIECGKKEGIMIGMCGEAAADPLLIPLWISFGLDEFSVNPASILATRKTIFEWSKENADQIAEQVMRFSTEEEMLKCLQEI